MELWPRSTVRSQGRRPTCVAFAASAGHEHLRPSDVQLSSEYAHWAAKQHDGIPFGQGTTFEALAAALASLGHSSETSWPYDEAADERAASHLPTPGATTDALTRLLPGAVAIRPSYGVIRREVDASAVVLLGLRVHQGWHAVPADGVITPPGPNARFAGHAVLVVGYRSLDGRSELVFRNSWGSAWGDHGYGYVSNQYLRHHAVKALRMGNV
jgi:C1A family cysteine protease